MMNKKFKKTIALVVAATAVASSFGFVGCGAMLDTDQTLEVNIWSAGYGVQFVTDLLNAFKEETWVKQKYPNLVIPDVFSDGNKTTLTTKLDSPSTNTVDLFFLTSLESYIGKDGAGNEYMSDLTDVVYNTEVPGEPGVTVLEKMDDSYVDSLWYYEKGQDSTFENIPFKSYVFPWASGMNGFLYNADYFGEDYLDMEVPLTTNQFLEVCKYVAEEGGLPYNTMQEKDGGGNYSILSCSGGNYLSYLYPIWWGQYETVEGYYNFYEGNYKMPGSADYEYSPKVFEQKGKLYTLQFMENILKWSNGYLFQGRTMYDTFAAQNKFLQGCGLFYANGDWFAKETASLREEIKIDDGKDYNIRMMRTPIISEIVFKTPSINSGNAYQNDDNTWYVDDESEQRLRAVIRAIDAGNATIEEARQADGSNDYLAGVTQTDYEYIMQARGVTHSIGPLHRAGIPSYAKGKEIAFDFLRFMATDKAQSIYIRATGGASLPFHYDLEERDPDLYNELFGNGNKTYLIEKDRLDMVYNSVYETKVLPEPSSFPLVRIGEMDGIRSLNKRNIIGYFNAESGAGTAKSLFENDIEYYMGNDGNEFNNCLEKAGLQ